MDWLMKMLWIEASIASGERLLLGNASIFANSQFAAALHNTERSIKNGNHLHFQRKEKAISWLVAFIDPDS